MSDNQRRLVCRLAFLLICALPTSLSTYLILHRPDADYWSRLLEAKLGIAVSIGSVATPLPRQVLLEGVTIGDPEAGQTMRLSEVQIDRQSDRMQVTVTDPVEVPVDALARVLRQLSSRLGQLEQDDRVWRFEFRNLSIVQDNFPIARFEPTVIEIGRRSVAGETGWSASLIASAGEADDSVLEVLFDRTIDRSVVRLTTKNCRLPCTLFQPWHGDFGIAGSQCTFSGTILVAAESGHDQFSGAIDGDLKNIPLDRISRLLGYPLRGVCDMNRFECQFSDGLVDSASGQVVSTQRGTISSSLLAALAELGVRVRSDVSYSDVLFSRIDFGVSVKEGWLSIAGHETDVREGERAVTASGILWDANGDALAICDDHRKTPLLEAAVVLAGESKSDDLSVALLDRFRIPARRVARVNGAKEQWE